MSGSRAQGDSKGRQRCKRMSVGMFGRKGGATPRGVAAGGVAPSALVEGVAVGVAAAVETAGAFQFQAAGAFQVAVAAGVAVAVAAGVAVAVAVAVGAAVAGSTVGAAVRAVAIAVIPSMAVTAGTVGAASTERQVTQRPAPNRATASPTPATANLFASA